MEFALIKNGTYVAGTSGNLGKRLSEIDGFGPSESKGEGLVLDNQLNVDFVFDRYCDVTVKDTAAKIVIDLNDEWDKISDTPLVMGCVIARNEYIEQNPAETVAPYLTAYFEGTSEVSISASVKRRRISKSPTDFSRAMKTASASTASRVS